MLYDPKWNICVTSRILLRAAAILEQYGWCKGYEIDDLGHRCVIGAIRESARELGLPSIDAHMAQELLLRHVGMPLHRWNDAPGVTKDVVTATLRARAAAL